MEQLQGAAQRMHEPWHQQPDCGRRETEHLPLAFRRLAIAKRYREPVRCHTDKDPSARHELPLQPPHHHLQQHLFPGGGRTRIPIAQGNQRCRGQSVEASLCRREAEDTPKTGSRRVRQHRTPASRRLSDPNVPAPCRDRQQTVGIRSDTRANSDPRAHEFRHTTDCTVLHGTDARSDHRFRRGFPTRRLQRRQPDGQSHAATRLSQRPTDQGRHRQELPR